MKRLFVLVCALGLWAAAWAAPEVNIVPKPLNVETGDGSFTVDAATVVTVGRDASLRSVGTARAGGTFRPGWWSRSRGVPSR